MNINHIDYISELPNKTLMVLYHAPFTNLTKKDDQSKEDWGLACSLKEYREKYGEPKEVYILNNWIFIIKE